MKKFLTMTLGLVMVIATAWTMMGYESAQAAGYNASAAVSYARKWTDSSGGSSHSSYNPAYKAYTKSAGYSSNSDCANYVSQALNYGGISRTNTWTPGAYAWVNVNGLKSFLLGLGYKGYSSSQIVRSQIRAGDVIWTSSSHVMLVSSVSGNTIKACGHTNNRRDYSIGTIVYYISMSGNSGIGDVNYTNVDQQYQIIDSTGLNMRSTPNGNLIINVPKGTVVHVTRKTTAKYGGYIWGYCTYAGRSGWICIGNSTWAKQVTNSTSERNTQKTYTIRSMSGVNCRSGAGTSYSRTGAVSMGSVIHYSQTKQANGYTWLLVESGSSFKSGSWGSCTGNWVPML